MNAQSKIKSKSYLYLQWRIRSQCNGNHYYMFAVPVMSILIKTSICSGSRIVQSELLLVFWNDLRLRSQRTNGEVTSHFCVSRNPNGEGLVHWPQYDLDERYLEIDLIQKAAKKLKEDKMEFWVQLTKQMSSERRREHTDLWELQGIHFPFTTRSKVNINLSECRF